MRLKNKTMEELILYTKDNTGDKKWQNRVDSYLEIISLYELQLKMAIDAGATSARVDGLRLIIEHNRAKLNKALDDLAKFKVASHKRELLKENK